MYLQKKMYQFTGENKGENENSPIKSKSSEQIKLGTAFYLFQGSSVICVTKVTPFTIYWEEKNVI